MKGAFRADLESLLSVHMRDVEKQMGAMSERISLDMVTDQGEKQVRLVNILIRGCRLETLVTIIIGGGEGGGLNYSEYTNKLII